MTSKKLAVVFLSAAAIPGTVLAHTPIEGIGSFYNGLLHPLLVPAHILLLVALGLLLGQRGIRQVEPALGVFAAATILGLIVAWFSGFEGSETVVLGLAAALGLLVAVSPKLGMHWLVLIGLLSGLALGIDSAQEQLLGQDRAVALFGSGIAIYFLALYPMAMADRLKDKGWQKIGIRIVGSWVAASALLVLTLSFAPRL